MLDKADFKMLESVNNNLADIHKLLIEILAIAIIKKGLDASDDR